MSRFFFLVDIEKQEYSENFPRMINWMDLLRVESSLDPVTFKKTHHDKGRVERIIVKISSCFLCCFGIQSPSSTIGLELTTKITPEPETNSNFCP